MPSRIKIKRLEWYHSTCYLRGAPAKIEPWLPLPVRWWLTCGRFFCHVTNASWKPSLFATTGSISRLANSIVSRFPTSFVFHFLHPNSVRTVLEQAVLASPLFTARRDAGRALALLRFRGGRKFLHGSSACALTICWLRSFPKLLLARNIFN